MNAQILHSGFDGLKFTLQAQIPTNLRADLADAKHCAKRDNAEYVLDCGPVKFNVTGKGARGFTAHTGDHGAVWLFQDSDDPIPNNPPITIDFRAFGLATGGLRVAEDHFRACMAALAIPYADNQLRVTRADFAVDFLAPWFEPDREALVAPPGTKITEYTGIDETATVSTGSRVQGLRAGAIANRQLAIYDKRVEVIQQGKLGWLEIWNAARLAQGNPPLDLKDRDASQVWRFELRLGSKQLRDKFQLRDWTDIRDMLGDAFTDAVKRIRYCTPSADQNRARWPEHELWRQFEMVVGNDLDENCSGVRPSDVAEANRVAKMRELDAQLAGLLVTRAAVSGVTADEFTDFLGGHIEALQRYIDEHPTPLTERLGKAAARYRWTD
ncbi:hypothetical protein [Thalassovita aquimarina]|uniref:Replication initiation factor n=1 Tax=Thalassovita aquimarina TaxID=2785917 RepID=A0ABS5HWY9_9RHOB|nr:hypothetical protein [Thalassovita aquimarina]MBR9653530.1 hypothetical protein [Thalassovita aquimarina]